MLRGRVVAAGEPTWTAEDRLWMLAWQYDQDERMPCGCHPSEASGRENDDMFVAEPRVCHRHRAVGFAHEARAAQKSSMHGIWFETYRRDDEEV